MDIDSVMVLLPLRCKWISTLTEGFPCVFFSCNANARVIPAKIGHGPHSSKMFVSFCILFVCKCVLHYCHRLATQLQLTNISYYISISCLTGLQFVMTDQHILCWVVTISVKNPPRTERCCVGPRSVYICRWSCWTARVPWQSADGRPHFSCGRRRRRMEACTVKLQDSWEVKNGPANCVCVCVCVCVCARAASRNPKSTNCLVAVTTQNLDTPRCTSQADTILKSLHLKC